MRAAVVGRSTAAHRGRGGARRGLGRGLPGPRARGLRAGRRPGAGRRGRPARQRLAVRGARHPGGERLLPAGRADLRDARDAGARERRGGARDRARPRDRARGLGRRRAHARRQRAAGGGVSRRPARDELSRGRGLRCAGAGGLPADAAREPPAGGAPRRGRGAGGGGTLRPPCPRRPADRSRARGGAGAARATRPRRLSRGDRRARLGRRAGAGIRQRPDVRASRARLRRRRAARLRAQQPPRRGDGERAAGCGLPARQRARSRHRPGGLPVARLGAGDRPGDRRRGSPGCVRRW